MRIFDIPIDTNSRKGTIKKIEDLLDSDTKHQIATINPEFLLEARRNKEFSQILGNCSIRVADGFGIILAHWLKGRRAPERFSGADLMRTLLKMADQRKLDLFLAVNKDGLSLFDEIRAVIKDSYPDISVQGKNLEIRQSLHAPPGIPETCSLVLCNFGAPEQEIFLSHMKGDNLRVVMGVGGSFDFLTGKIKRAPIWMRRSGLEWLWRLVQQPKRWKRIFRAVILFPLLLMKREKMGNL